MSLRHLISSFFVVLLVLSACGSDRSTSAQRTGSGREVTTPPLAPPCPTTEHGAPQITGLTPTALRTGQALTISGCNFAGFEGDIRVWIVNEAGEQGLLLAGTGSTANRITIALPAKVCQMDVSYSGAECPMFLPLPSGNYQVYATAWGQNSSQEKLTIL